MNLKLLQKTLCIIISILLVFGPAPKAFALPEGQNVVAGSATFTEQGNTLNVNQATSKAIINYNSFSIDTQEAVNFHQPSSSSIALNRVVGIDPSSILGSLTANGQVFLINPNGILFGQGAQINVHGLVASTLNIANDDFLSNNYKFLQDPAKALARSAYSQRRRLHSLSSPYSRELRCNPG
jgi:filamentous hemagglutinin family protein